MRDIDDELDMTLPELKRREIPFERRLRNELRERRVMFVKVKPTIEGFPDRLAIGYGRMLLVEVKREGGELSQTQMLMHGTIKAQGVGVLVVYGPHVKLAADRVQNVLLKQPR